MKKAEKILAELYRNISTEELKEKVRSNPKDFTRERKLGFVSLLLLIMNMLTRTIQIEVDEFTKRFSSKEISTYTKQSFSDARLKISPKVFKILNNDFIKSFYMDEDYKKYKGYRLLAIDGSKIQLPNTKNTREKYGFIKNNLEKFEIAQALTSILYDVENKIVLSSILSGCDESERKLAQDNVKEMLLQNQKEIRNLILFDRGYPSFEIIRFIEENSIKYLMRVKSNFFREIIETKTTDENVEIEITPSRKKHLKKQGTIVETGEKLHVRVIKFLLPSGEEEILITNLTKEDVSFEECHELYFKRWGIETKYNELKNKFEIENFSGKTTTVIEQDFYATVLLANIASIIEQDAQTEYESKNNSKKNTNIV